MYNQNHMFRFFYSNKYCEYISDTLEVDDPSNSEFEYIVECQTKKYPLSS